MYAYLILTTLAVVLSGWLLWRRTHSQGPLKLTILNGPQSASYFYGASRTLARSDDHGELFEEWSKLYGPVFQIPTAFGGRRTVILDPRAVNHFYSRERSVYVKSKLSRAVISNLFGHGLLWAEGEVHKRQRKALTPAFSNSAIRQLTRVFFDSSYKLKTKWDSLIEESSDTSGVIIDVQHWVNLVALDSIGIAGFAFDFESLSGSPSPVASAFAALTSGLSDSSTASNILFLLGARFPLIAKLPLQRNRVLKTMRKALGEVAKGILAREREMRESGEKAEEGSNPRSIIELLLKAEAEEADVKVRLDKDEVPAQMGIPPYLTLQWALIELARAPHVQDQLRAELQQFRSSHGRDPAWDELVAVGGSELPYLDAVVHETLRLHPAVAESTREARFARTDDVIPLTAPISTPQGEIDYITVPKGSIVTVHVRCINRSEAFWTPSIQFEFKPERWLVGEQDTVPGQAETLKAYRHILTFIDGPRACLGRGFAIAEFKAVLATLLLHFTFEFPMPTAPKIVRRHGVVRRPAVDGEEGTRVPMRVKKAGICGGSVGFLSYNPCYLQLKVLAGYYYGTMIVN
ncbi:cytochrome P450 [Mycena amicta]|nr:cytochrome P450 [Mycena amicta]